MNKDVNTKSQKDGITLGNTPNSNCLTITDRVALSKAIKHNHQSKLSLYLTKNVFLYQLYIIFLYACTVVFTLRQ